MRLRTIEDAEEFMEVIKSCQGPVYILDWRVDKSEEPNLQINLKSTISMYLGITKLLSEHGDWFEIYANRGEDEAKIMKFLMEKTNEVSASDSPV